MCNHKCTEGKKELSLKLGLESLNDAPQSDEGRHHIFQLKRQIVQSLVDKVLIEKDRTLKVVIKLNILFLLQKTDNFSEVPPAGTYTRTPISPARPHPAGSCE